MFNTIITSIGNINGYDLTAAGAIIALIMAGVLFTLAVQELRRR